MSLQLLTIQNWLQHHATYRSDHLAIVFEEKRLTYGQLHEQVSMLANAFLQAGVGKGDKVTTLLYNSLELYETYWACAAIGAVAVPLSPLLRGQGLINLIENADTKLLITCNELAGYIDGIKENLKISTSDFWVIDEIAEGYSSYQQKKKNASIKLKNVDAVDGGDPYNIIYSSGTTGIPKGILISHAVRSLYGSLFANAFRMTPESVVMHSGAIIFNGSFLTLMPAMYLGCTYILQKNFNPHEIIDVIHKENVTHTILVPSQIINCLQLESFNKQHLSSLEYVLSVGAPLLQEHKDELNKKLPGVFYELYGLTEGFMTILDKGDVQRKACSVGRPPQFMELKIVNDTGRELEAWKVGEIIGKSPLLMSGYYKNETQTQEAIKDGWLYTGDLGYVDNDGFLYLTGRKKDLIISGGVNVYPGDIEEIIIHHPCIKDVAVFGVPHQEWGETPVAAIVFKENKNINAGELKSWINRHIEARYQKVNDVIILNELPRNVAGKILKKDLKENYVKEHV